MKRNWEGTKRTSHFKEPNRRLSGSILTATHSKKGWAKHQGVPELKSASSNGPALVSFPCSSLEGSSRWPCGFAVNVRMEFRAAASGALRKLHFCRRKPARVILLATTKVKVVSPPSDLLCLFPPFIFVALLAHCDYLCYNTVYSIVVIGSLIFLLF